MPSRTSNERLRPGKVEVTLFKPFDDAERVQIVIEGVPCARIRWIELLFTRMTEGRMSDIVDERQCLRQIRIESQRGGHGASDLRHFQRMREAIAKMIGEARGENLSLRLEPAESAGMDDAVAVARVVIAVGMRDFRVAPSPRIAHVHCIGSELHYAQFSV